MGPIAFYIGIPMQSQDIQGSYQGHGTGQYESNPEIILI